MLSHTNTRSDGVVGALARLTALLTLFFWMFWAELTWIRSNSPHSSESVHVVVAPLMIVLLVYARRWAIIRSMSRGSSWGLALIMAGLLLYAAVTWPFSYGYIRYFAMIPVLAGIVLVSCGWGVLMRSVPMLLLVVFAIPLGSRIYARLIIRPETYTIKAVAAALSRLPGVNTAVKGVDIFFQSDFCSGVVALGYSNRGARLLMAFAAMGLFVVFWRRRSIGRLFVTACVAIPIVLFCSLFRLICWGFLNIYVLSDPTNSLACDISAVLSLLLSYVLFVFVSSARLGLFTDVRGDDPPGGAAYA